MQSAIDIEKTTKRFYDRYSFELACFADCIEGISTDDDRLRYASLTLNRLMFVYFLQAQGFLDNNLDYLRCQLQRFDHGRQGRTKIDFYRSFLLHLFHEGLGQSQAERTPELVNLLGDVPFLNGGLFDIHDLERDNPTISIAANAFKQVFDFFDNYQWIMEESPSRGENEITPVILGHIFEKYVNQKQMGAYYTDDDVTGFIARNTVIPAIFDATKEQCPQLFEEDSDVWKWLRENPDRYIFPSVGHGLIWDVRSNDGSYQIEEQRELPKYIEAGLNDMSWQSEWDKAAPKDFALPTETWREAISRRQKCEEVKRAISLGHVREINEMITLNLNVEQFAEDVITRLHDAKFLRAFWQSINQVSILDPTCGSGAFLFAALKILESLYLACLEGMERCIKVEKVRRSTLSTDARYIEDILSQVATLPNGRYFVLKNIVLRNIYGVDIMPEAVEICKLRLFLRLIAQLDPADDVEPLPDIDFNIRTGNALVGFSSVDELRDVVSLTPEGQHRAMFADELASLEHIESEADSAGAVFDQYRWNQIILNEDEIVGHKDDLNRRLANLNEELNRLLATNYGIEMPDDLSYSPWLMVNQPFHWFIEFYGIMANGGFDVVIGNPPYVKTRKVDYQIRIDGNHVFPDIYAYILLRAMKIRHRKGRCGFVVPLSVEFSRDFKDLRRSLISDESNWFASFDNIPASLFYGVQQRCTIWLNDAKDNALYTTRLFRWRSSYRANLLSTVYYAAVPDLVEPCEFGIPRVSSEQESNLLKLHVNAAANQQACAYVGPLTSERVSLNFSQTARNFVSTYIDSPPVLDANDLTPLGSVSSGETNLDSRERSLAGLAITSSDVFFWYWLVRGDGFHVTNWLITDFLAPLYSFPSDELLRLRLVGELLHEYRNTALVFKKNAGKFVGNYNYQHLKPLTRRADLLYVAGIGGNWHDLQHVISFVKRVRAINESAGEKKIPVEIKNRYQAPDARTLEQDDRLPEVDSWLASRYRVSVEQVKLATKF